MPPIYVVVVDNDPIYIGLATRFLSNQENLFVSGVLLGRDDLIKSTQVFAPDIMLYNLNNPLRQDLETISLLKEISPSTHIIAVSSNISEHTRRQVLHAGADNFVKRNRMNIEFLPMMWKLITMYRHRHQKWEMDTAPLTPPNGNFSFQSNGQIH
jgi:DNA-binding NarL/FixJ family response regulator